MKVKSAIELNIEPGLEDAPPKLVAIRKLKDILVKIYELVETIHTDQTGAFPVTSQQGYQYIMVGIHIDANCIFCETMKNRTEGEMINAYQKMVDRMLLAGLGLKHHRLDNECSDNFKKCIRKNNMTHELVLPNCHRRNMAERAIQMFKNHFVAILSGVDDRFPLSLWCYLIRPAKLTVNLLRKSNVVPNISAYAHVHRQHDYMKCPFAPLGCSVMAHVKPKNRRTWDFHGEVGYSIGTLMEHHRCFNVYIVKTRATSISDSVFFKHQYITNPQIMPETIVMKAAAELTSALKGTVSQVAETADALAKVSDLFQKIAASKADRTKAKEQRNLHRTHPSSRRAVPIPRVKNEPPARQAVPIPKVLATPRVDDCQVVGGRSRSRLQIVTCGTPNQGQHRPSPIVRPNYISQDVDEDQPCWYNTRSRATSIMQEAM
jgi:hypothetical protein